MTWSAIGIDPGKNGAVVALVLGEGQIQAVYQALTRSGAPNLEPALMGRMLQDADDAVRLAGAVPASTVAVLERVGAMPGQGVSSTYSFGHGRGVWAGLVAARPMNVLEPRPAQWAGAVLRNIPGEGKARAIMRASTVAGLDLIPPGCRVPHDGLADAACLALYGLGALLSPVRT